MIIQLKLSAFFIIYAIILWIPIIEICLLKKFFKNIESIRGCFLLIGFFLVIPLGFKMCQSVKTFYLRNEFENKTNETVIADTIKDGCLHFYTSNKKEYELNCTNNLIEIDYIVKEV